MAGVSRCVSVALALCFFGTGAVARADDDSERAEQAFKAGNRAFGAGDYHAAFDAYRTAWSLKQTFDIACNLGRTEVELSLSRDAAEHLDYCLRTFSVSSRGEVRDANKRFRELFQRVRREVAALTLEVRPAGAEITVDGASYGVAPLGRDLFLAPGQHLVRARLAGFEDEERAITAEAGGTLSALISLTSRANGVAPPPVVPAPAAAPAPAPHEPPPPAVPPAREDAGIEPRTIVVVSGAVASLVVLGIGAGFALDADAARSDAARLGESVHREPLSSCTGTAPSSDCAALRAEIRHEQQSRDRSDVALTVGALLGAATLGAWLVIPDFAHHGGSRLRASPFIGVEASGLAVSGDY